MRYEPFIIDKIIPIIINIGLGLILLSPLPFGNVETWSVSMFKIISFITFGVWLTAKILKGRIRLFESPVYLPMALFFVLVILQTVQLPAFLLGVISPQTATLWQNQSEALQFIFGEEIALHNTISIYPFVTREKLLLYISYAAFFIVASDYIRTRKQIKRFFWILFTVATIESIIGLMQYIASGTKVAASGTYVNPNHFAGFLVLVIPVFLGYLLYLYFKHGAVITHLGNRIKLPGSSQLVMFFTVSLMAISMVLAQSRGAILSFAASLFFFHILISRSKKSISTKWLLGSFIAIILLYSIWIGLDPVIDKFTDTTREIPNRTYIWTDSMNMIKDFPLWGVGLGNFSLAYTLYKKEAYWPQVFDHAHNDYIELACETGLIGFILVFWALGGYFRRLIENQKRIMPEQDPFRYYIMLGAISGMFGMFAHTITEFTFQIPSNAYYFTFLFALTARLSEQMVNKSES